MNKCQRPTAFHEAGHAVAFWWNGQRINRITVRTRADALTGPLLDLRGNPQRAEGLVEADYLVPCPSCEAAGIAEYLPSLIESIERDLLDCFSGPVAEAIYRHARPDRLISGSGRGDRLRGHELIRLLPARKLLDAEARAIIQCSCLLHRYWTAVTLVAALLQEQGTVEGEAISALLCEITGESPVLFGNDLALLRPQSGRPCHAPHSR